MKGFKALLLATIILGVSTQTAHGGSGFSVGLNLSYNKGYPMGAFPIGYGAGAASMGALYNCFSSPQMMSAANAGLYNQGAFGPGFGPGMGPGFGPGMGPGFGPGQGFMQPPMMPPLPALPPPVAYQPTPIAQPMPMPVPGIGQGYCGGVCMPPPCMSAGCMGMGRGIASGGMGYQGDGIYFGAHGQVIIDDRGVMEWEKNDIAGIVGATGGTLMGLSSNVVPFAPYRHAPSPIPTWYQQGPRMYELQERPAAH